MGTLNDKFTVAQLRLKGYAVTAVHIELDGVDRKKVEATMFRYGCLALDEQYMAMARKEGWTVPYPGDLKAGASEAAHYSTNRYAASWLEAASAGQFVPEKDPMICPHCDECIDANGLTGRNTCCCPSCGNPVFSVGLRGIAVGRLFLITEGGEKRQFVKIADGNDEENAVFVGPADDAEFYPGDKATIGMDCFIYPF